MNIQLRLRAVERATARLIQSHSPVSPSAIDRIEELMLLNADAAMTFSPEVEAGIQAAVEREMRFAMPDYQADAGS